MFIWANVEVNFGVISGQCCLCLNVNDYADIRLTSLRTSATAFIFDVQNEITR